MQIQYLLRNHLLQERLVIHVSPCVYHQVTIIDICIALVFIYDYHPNSINLFEAYFTPQAQALLHARLQATRGNALPVPETTLWSFMTQMASALKTIHAAGLSARTMDPTKILMTSKNRLRISCCGVLDVLQYEVASQKVAFHQVRTSLYNFNVDKITFLLARRFIEFWQVVDFVSL